MGVATRIHGAALRNINVDIIGIHQDFSIPKEAIVLPSVIGSPGCYIDSSGKFYCPGRHGIGVTVR